MTRTASAVSSSFWAVFEVPVKVVAIFREIHLFLFAWSNHACFHRIGERVVSENQFAIERPAIPLTAQPSGLGCPENHPTIWRWLRVCISEQTKRQACVRQQHTSKREVSKVKESRRRGTKGLRGENRREMGSRKERGKGGRYVKYLTLPCLSLYRQRPACAVPGLATSLELSLRGL